MVVTFNLCRCGSLKQCKIIAHVQQLATMILKTMEGQNCPY